MQQTFVCHTPVRRLPLELLDKCQVVLSKAHVILRNNASNVTKAWGIMGVCRVGCDADTMQRVVNEGLLSQRAVSDAIACGRQIVGHFKHSPLKGSWLQGLLLLRTV